MDFTVAKHLIQALVKKAQIKHGLRRICIAACVPKLFSEVDKKAYEDLLLLLFRDVLLTDMELEEYIHSMSELDRKKYEAVIAITKDEPLEYVKEQLEETVAYAGQKGITKEKVMEILAQVESG